MELGRKANYTYRGGSSSVQFTMLLMIAKLTRDATEEAASKEAIDLIRQK